VYETEPRGPIADQPDFLNACLEIDTDLGPEDLLARCKGVEERIGRGGDGRDQGPRVIDIDVLLLGDLSRGADPVLPHPDILERRFVLEPLLELDPALSLPDGTRLAEVRGRVADQHVRAAGSL
jgi:2-amino-4-hydroxy-6-hydroxymethyldihydropteridine diphosphokinase